MSLASSLAGLTPADRDAYLHNLWVQLTGTEQWEAMTIAIRQIEDGAHSALLAPRADPYERAHAAGQVVACQRLLATAHAASTFDPQTAEYSADLGADDDVVADDEQLI